MNKSTAKIVSVLSESIEQAYVDTPTVEDAEKLAAKFLHAQLIIANELAGSDLDSRMKKTGLKAIKATVYMDTVAASDKKPTEAMITSIIDTSDLVKAEQRQFDSAEVEVELLKSYYQIFREAHIYFRGIAKGSFNG